jgi:hypothetical protein
MFHSEWLDIVFLLPVSGLLAPLSRFIKDDISGDYDTLIDMVIAMICLGPGLIPNEDGSLTFVVEFLQVWPRVINVRDAAKCAEVVDRRNLIVPSFEWSPAVEGAHRCPIEDVDLRQHSLALEVAGQCLCLEHALRHGHHTLVSPFHHHILLQRIGGGELVIHAGLHVVLAELHQHEFAAMISL